MRPSTFDRSAACAGALVMTLLAGAIFLGSRGLRDYDLALLPYTLGVLFASFTVTYRYAVWLQRPATNVYWRRGFELLSKRGQVLRNALFLARSARSNLFAQRFIRRRSRTRWLAHFCFAWGSMVAAAVTFPLVFGWLHFETRLDDPNVYQVVALGFVADEFRAVSFKRYVMFNLLNASAVAVIFGAALALHRRLRDPGSLARQTFGNDIVPLLILIAISGTGLMLTFSTHLLRGYGYSVISLIHAFVITATLLYLPFGKFFHVFQRPAQLSVTLYRRANQEEPPALCRVCGEGFAGAMHVADLKQVLTRVDLDWKLDGAVSHYSDVCPRCRRRLFGFSQGRVMGRSGNAVAPTEVG